MRPVRDISDLENFRTEPFVGSSLQIIKRDPVEPEPVGTIVLCAFRITGYDKDCDGSLMARLEHINVKAEYTGWVADSIGLYSDCGLVCSQEELEALFGIDAKKV
jgi:hypothetical protein